MASKERMEIAEQQAAQMLQLLQQNTELTETTKLLSVQIEKLTRDLHGTVCRDIPGA